MKKIFLTTCVLCFLLLFSSWSVANRIEDKFLSIVPQLDRHISNTKQDSLITQLQAFQAKINTLKHGAKKELLQLILMYLQQSLNETSLTTTMNDGDTIAVDYSLYITTNTGKILKDTSVYSLAEKYNTIQPGRTYEPLQFQYGKGQMIPGFEEAVATMKLGEKKSIIILPRDGYGPKNIDMIQKVEKKVFTEAGIEPKKGQTFNFSFAPGEVISVDGETVLVDFNHELAGKVLYFDIELKNITKKTDSI